MLLLLPYHELCLRIVLQNRKKLSPAGASQIGLFSLKVTAFKYNSNLSQAGAKKAGDQQYQKKKKSTSQGPRVKSLIPENSFHTCPSPWKFNQLKKPHHMGKGAFLGLSGIRGKVLRSPVKKAAAS